MGHDEGLNWLFAAGREVNFPDEAYGERQKNGIVADVSVGGDTIIISKLDKLLERL